MNIVLNIVQFREELPEKKHFYGMTLEMMYFRAELVQLIVSRSDSELEVQRYGMKKNTFLILWCWKMNCEWDNVKTVSKPPKLAFWKPNRGNWVFGFWILRSVQFLEIRYPTFSSDSAHP